MALNPETGQFWVTEQGPNGGDEINVLKPGANYGWPFVSHGRNYMGPKVSESTSARGHRAAGRCLDPVDRRDRGDLLHRREISGLEAELFRRRVARGGDAAHRSYRADRVQREMGGDAARVAAPGAQAARSRCPSRTRWIAVCLDLGERRGGASHRTGGRSEPVVVEPRGRASCVFKERWPPRKLQSSGRRAPPSRQSRWQSRSTRLSQPVRLARNRDWCSVPREPLPRTDRG